MNFCLRTIVISISLFRSTQSWAGKLTIASNTGAVKALITTVEVVAGAAGANLEVMGYDDVQKKNVSCQIVGISVADAAALSTSIVGARIKTTAPAMLIEASDVFCGKAIAKVIPGVPRSIYVVDFKAGASISVSRSAGF